MQRSKELQRRDSELLEVISFWKPQDFKDLETVSSSRSIHAPIKPLSRVFQNSFAATAATDLTYGM